GGGGRGVRPGARGASQGRSPHGLPVEKRLPRLAERRFGGTAVVRLELESVKGGRVVAGGDHHTANRAPRFDSVRNGRGRGRLRGEHDGKAIATKDLRRAPGELIGEKAPIITNDHAPGGSLDRMEVPVIRRGLGDPLQVGEGEVLGNNRPPTVGSELNLAHPWTPSSGRSDWFACVASPRISRASAAPPPRRSL